MNGSSSTYYTDRLDAIILAGGRGTRLQSMVSDRPKPLAEVAGRPFLEWLLLALRAQLVRRAVLATGYKGEMVEAAFGDGARLGMELAYAHETVPLGTGGAARHALEQVTTDHVLVLNGDSFCPFNVRRLVESHQRTGARATLWLVPMDDCRRYGAVDVADDGRVRSFHEKSPDLGTGLINAGVYLFDRRTLADIPAGRAMSLERDTFPTLIGDGLYATVGEGPFLDIGTPASYASAERFFDDHRALWSDVL
jgi:NDP-sugar pyrophosphorylase family protein